MIFGIAQGFHESKQKLIFNFPNKAAAKNHQRTYGKQLFNFKNILKQKLFSRPSTLDSVTAQRTYCISATFGPK
jgi:hypothetical protein